MKNQSVISLLSSLVAMDSQSSKNNTPIISFLETLFNGFETSTQNWTREEDGVRGKNLIVKIPGISSDQCMIFVCHTDTVPPSDSWETNPFILEETEGRLYGLGVCDTKGGIAAAIHALLTLKNKPARDIYFVFDGDEEVGVTGAKKFKKSCKLKNPQFIFIEPTEKNVMISQRGVLSATIRTHGVAQHASLGTPAKNEAQSAIYKMAKVINALIQDAEKISHETDSILGSNSQNLGIISGGTAKNVIPDICEMSLDRRLLTSRSPEGEIKRIKELLQNIDKRIEITDISTAPSFQTNEKSEFVGNIKKIMKDYYSGASLEPFTAWSEAGLFQELGDVIILGPGSLVGQAHKANEFIEAKDLFNFVHIYQKIMLTA